MPLGFAKKRNKNTNLTMSNFRMNSKKVDTLKRPSGIFLDSNYTITSKRNNHGKSDRFTYKKNKTKNTIFSSYNENVEPVVNKYKHDFDKRYDEANEVDLKLSLTENRMKKYFKDKIKKNEAYTMKYLEECFTTTERRIEEILKEKISEIDKKLSVLTDKKNKHHVVDSQIKDEVNKQLSISPKGSDSKMLDAFQQMQMKNEMAEVLKTLFVEKKIYMITDLTSDEIKISTRIYMLAEMKKIKYWKKGLEYFMMLVLSRDRKSRKEMLQAISGYTKQEGVLNRLNPFSRNR